MYFKNNKNSNSFIFFDDKSNEKNDLVKIIAQKKFKSKSTKSTISFQFDNFDKITLNDNYESFKLKSIVNNLKDDNVIFYLDLYSNSIVTKISFNKFIRTRDQIKKTRLNKR